MTTVTYLRIRPLAIFATSAFKAAGIQRRAQHFIQIIAEVVLGVFVRKKTSLLRSFALRPAPPRAALPPLTPPLATVPRTAALGLRLFVASRELSVPMQTTHNAQPIPSATSLLFVAGASDTWTFARTLFPKVEGLPRNIIVSLTRGANGPQFVPPVGFPSPLLHSMETINNQT